MKRNREDIFIVFAVLFLFAFLTGCARVKTYSVDKDRVDQNLVSGNQGYLSGTPEAPSPDRKMTRKTYVTEVELGKPYGVRVSRPVPGTQAAQEPALESQEASETMPASAVMPAATSYTVTHNDTLQKISQKVYGTSKKWKKIFEANKDKLKTPDRIYPGQVLKIPQE